MKEDEIVRKNLDLIADFMRYAFDHPDVLDKIPKGAQLVILPEDDDELHQENVKTLKKHEENGLPVTVVKMRAPKPVVSSIEVVQPAT